MKLHGKKNYLGSLNRFSAPLLPNTQDWALALTRAAVIRPLTDQAELTERLVATASAELGISRSLVYRLVAKFRKRPQVSSLLPGKRGRKAAARTLSEAAEAVVRDAIVSVYLQREKPRLSMVCEPSDFETRIYPINMRVCEVLDAGARPA